jgi:hypothetical protein
MSERQHPEEVGVVAMMFPDLCQRVEESRPGVLLAQDIVQKLRHLHGGEVFRMALEDRLENIQRAVIGAGPPCPQALQPGGFPIVQLLLATSSAFQIDIGLAVCLVGLAIEEERRGVHLHQRRRTLDGRVDDRFEPLVEAEQASGKIAGCDRIGLRCGGERQLAPINRHT